MLRALRDDRGQGLGEYALILGFVAVLCVGAVIFIGQQILGSYQDIGTTYP
jgi:Flp pilus assembly pilin Flp